MVSVAPIGNQTPRELRRRVVLPARLRMGASWIDACILNVSSRGLMIHSGRETPQGSVVELRRGEHVIFARVVWRDGARAGLQADERLPVEDILTLSQSPALQLTAADALLIERRRMPRPPTHSESRLRARAMEFAAIGMIAATLAAGSFAMVEQAFAKPLTLVEAAFAR